MTQWREIGQIKRDNERERLAREPATITPGLQKIAA